ncbi:MAG TPA: maleylpyruvate isomerase N-terminal domain-containing protein [Spirochaetia bacterium]|nr:maleylpyruvate isomerase N-terminal domain-containing protein [Spirochaetia bacterium]
MGNTYSQRNREELEHMRTVIARLTDHQLLLPAGGPGWTVSGLLGHIAFWDQRAIVLAHKWKTGGTGSPAGDVDVINDSMKPFLLAMPGRRAAELALEAAQTCDQEIDSLDAETLARVEANGQPRMDRASHRAHHLQQIEKAIG